MKICIKCKEELSPDKFYKHPATKDGFLTSCKKCCDKYREINRDKINIQRRQRYRKDSSLEIARVLKYNQQHHVERSEYTKRYQQTIKGSFSIYKGNAVSKDREWQLSLEQFERLVQSPCVYCNEIDSKGFNGIDRIDNMLGYTKENCDPCCSMCNYMKQDYSKEEFLRKISLIYNKFEENYGTRSKG